MVIKFMSIGKLEELIHAETSLDMEDKPSENGENQHEHKEHVWQEKGRRIKPWSCETRTTLIETVEYPFYFLWLKSSAAL